MVHRRAARFMKGRYRMYEIVTRMLEELTMAPLSKRRENSRLIFFYKIINNLAMVPHSCLEKADGRTRKKHSIKFRHIGCNVDPYGQSFFPKSISAWNGLAQEIAEANTLDTFKSKLARRSISNHIRKKILLIMEPEAEPEQEFAKAKYLDWTLSDNLGWAKHIQNVTRILETQR